MKYFKKNNFLHKKYSTKSTKNPLFIEICREYWNIEIEKSRKTKELIFLEYITKFVKHSEVNH